LRIVQPRDQLAGFECVNGGVPKVGVVRQRRFGERRPQMAIGQAGGECATHHCHRFRFVFGFDGGDKGVRIPFGYALRIRKNIGAQRVRGEMRHWFQ
jgi:hypothetical protein